MHGVEKPLVFGRILRVVFGVGSLVAVPFVGELVWQAVLALLGISFIVGGVMANPGCELTALPNLLFRTRAHCF